MLFLALAEEMVVHTYNVLITIEFSWENSRCLLAHEELEGVPLPIPGQKKERYTFRILDVPARHKTSYVAELLVHKLNNLKGRPGVDYSIAYNIPWEQLRDGSIVSEEGDLTADEVLNELGVSRYTLTVITGKGELPVSRIPQKVGGPRPMKINRADLNYYLAHRKGRGRPPKKED